MIPEHLARYIDPAKLAILRDYLSEIRKYADHHPGLELEQLRHEMVRIKSLAEACLELCNVGSR